MSRQAQWPAWSRKPYTQLGEAEIKCGTTGWQSHVCRSTSFVPIYPYGPPPPVHCHRYGLLDPPLTQTITTKPEYDARMRVIMTDNETDNIPIWSIHLYPGLDRRGRTTGIGVG